MTTLSFVGKTAIITGAGGALGRAYAFDLAKRGCNLLINDVFATLSGTAQQKAEVENAAGLLNQSFFVHLFE
jgi:NAD(P)-dependent dehydrogenase (short-subunit alcohol dehydrogenase family)